MTTHNFGLRLVTVALGAFILSQSAQDGSADDGPQTREVRVEDVQAGRVTIIGALGKPVGNAVTIRGVWVLPDAQQKDQSPLFQATHLEGHELSSPINLSGSQVAPMCQQGVSGIVDNVAWSWRATSNGKLAPPTFDVGEQWEFVGFETVQSYSAPYSWIEGLQVPGHTPPPAFGAKFHYGRARRISITQQHSVKEPPLSKRQFPQYRKAAR